MNATKSVSSEPEIKSKVERICRRKNTTAPIKYNTIGSSSRPIELSELSVAATPIVVPTCEIFADPYTGMVDCLFVSQSLALRLLEIGVV